MSRRMPLFLAACLIAEIWVMIRVGQWIGGWETFGLILLIGFAGAWLAREEGRRVWREARRLLESGEPPGFAILDGLCVMAGGLLLLLPGFLSDLAGLALLLPFTRHYFRLRLYRWLERKLRGGSLSIRVGPFRW